MTNGMAAAAGAALIGASLVPALHAQTPTADEAMAAAIEIAAELEQRGTCDLSLHGAPQRDEMTGRWLIAYSGVGPACDEAGTALQSLGERADIAFFRRPNADEVQALIGEMRASVRRGFACLIGFRGEPRFDDDSHVWTVRYYASGQQCDDAAEELQRQGRALRISFQRFR
jgi:hypothetical protein